MKLVVLAVAVWMFLIFYYMQPDSVQSKVNLFIDCRRIVVYQESAVWEGIAAM